MTEADWRLFALKGSLEDVMLLRKGSIGELLALGFHQVKGKCHGDGTLFAIGRTSSLGAFLFLLQDFFVFERLLSELCARDPSPLFCRILLRCRPCTLPCCAASHIRIKQALQSSLSKISVACSAIA